MLAVLTTLAEAYNYTYSAPITGDPAGTAAASTAMTLIWMIVWLPLAILEIVGMWKVFVKAGRPGWAAIVPVYNNLQLIWMTGRPWWWILLMLIPIVNIVVIIMILHDLSKSFGRGVGTTLLLFFLPFIGFPILGFGSATYNGPAYPQSTAGGTTPVADTTPQPPVKPAM
jgi:uncharacterized protein DUF5684